MITSCLFDDAGSVCYSLQNMRAFFAACQRRRLFAAGCGSEAFLLPSVAAGASFNWQCPASLVGFDPTLLICEKKRGVEPPRRSCPKEPLEGFLWTLPETEGPRSLWHPGDARYRNFSSRALLRTFERSIVGSTTNLADPTRRKANFLWKFLCAGGASADCGGDPIPTAVPPQGFLQSKNALRRRKTAKSAARQSDRCTNCKPGCNCNPEREYQ